MTLFATIDFSHVENIYWMSRMGNDGIRIMFIIFTRGISTKAERLKVYNCARLYSFVFITTSRFIKENVKETGDSICENYTMPTCNKCLYNDIVNREILSCN